MNEKKSKRNVLENSVHLVYARKAFASKPCTNITANTIDKNYHLSLDQIDSVSSYTGL